jgi:hypothetical protein
MYCAFYMRTLEHPSLLLRESLAHILRFSLSVAVLQVEYIPRARVLLQSFHQNSFHLFIPVAEPHPSLALYLGPDDELIDCDEDPACADMDSNSLATQERSLSGV